MVPTLMGNFIGGGRGGGGEDDDDCAGRAVHFQHDKTVEEGVATVASVEPLHPRSHSHTSSTSSGFASAKQQAEERIYEARSMQWSNNLPHPAAALAHREWATRERNAGGFSGLGGVGGMGGGGSGVLHGSFDTVQASRLHRGSPTRGFSRPSSAPSGPQTDGRLTGVVRVVPLPCAWDDSRRNQHELRWRKAAPPPEAGRKSSSTLTPRTRRIKQGEGRAPEPPPEPCPFQGTNKGRLMRGAPSSQKGRLERAAFALGAGGIWQQVPDDRHRQLGQGRSPAEVGFTTSRRTGSPAFVYKTSTARVPKLRVNGTNFVSIEKPTRLIYLDDGKASQQAVHGSNHAPKTAPAAASLTLPDLHMSLGAARSSTGKGTTSRKGRELSSSSNVAGYDMPRSFSSPRGAGFGARHNPPQTAAFAPDHDAATRSPPSLEEDKRSTQKLRKGRLPRPDSAARPGSTSARWKWSSSTEGVSKRPASSYVPWSRSPNAVEWRLPHRLVPTSPRPSSLRAAEIIGVTSPRPRHGVKVVPGGGGGGGGGVSGGGGGAESHLDLEELPISLIEQDYGKDTEEAVASVQCDSPCDAEEEEEYVMLLAKELVDSELDELDAEYRNMSPPGICTDEERAAALKIQAAHRGKDSRAHPQALKAEAVAAGAEVAADADLFAGTEEDKNAAALKIHSLGRGRAARAEVARLRAEAATEAGTATDVNIGDAPAPAPALAAEDMTCATTDEDHVGAEQTAAVAVQASPLVAVDETSSLMNAALQRETTRLEAAFMARIERAEERARLAEARAAALAAQIADEVDKA